MQEDGDDNGWRPAAGRDVLRLRAGLLAQTREFFARRGVLEVQTPVLMRQAVSTPQIDSFALAGEPLRYLRTSPEFAHKRLLAAGVGDVYELGPVFRDGERGRRHSPEFSMLEWYRVGIDHFALMNEVDELLSGLLSGVVVDTHTLTYAEAFSRHANVDVFEASGDDLADVARTHGVAPRTGLSRDGWLDLLFATVVSPNFAAHTLTIVHAYPASQAALACIDPDDGRVAQRFEVFVGALELANGFNELLDPAEQRARFDDDNRQRRQLGKTQTVIDEAFISALISGLPSCAGVAVGFDRVVMLATGVGNIDDTLTFAWERT